MGGELLSGVYWTLLVEVKFYMLVALIMKIGIWKNYKYQILLFWLLIAIINQFASNNTIANTLLDLRFAGHFSLGILAYLYLIKKNKSPWMIPVLAMSVWLVFHNMIGYTTWIRGLTEIKYSDIDIFFGMSVIFSVLFLAIHMKKIIVPNQAAIYAGALSFTLYLTHADFGYFIRTQYYRRLVVYFPWLLGIVNEHIIMMTEIACSFIVAAIFLKIASIETAAIKKIFHPNAKKTEEEEPQS